MNCQSFQNQIDEAAFTAELDRHLADCADCKTFREERECLSRLLSKIECVNAPANFEFGVRAKLNSLPAANGSRVWVRRFAFASPALAVVAVSAFIFTNYNAYSPNSNQPIAVQTGNVAPISNPSPTVSQTQPILAETNSNAATNATVPAQMPKQNTPAANRGDQTTARNAEPGIKKQNASKPEKDKTRSITVDEPLQNQLISLGQAEVLIQPEFKGKVTAHQFLSFFGIEEISENGEVKSVTSNSAAAEKGVLAGDRIESVNGQKFAGADLNNSFLQITIEIIRNGKKRVVTILPK